MRHRDNFRRLARGEMRRYRKACFAEAVRRLVPDIRADDLVSSQRSAYVPSMIIMPAQRLEMDFVIERMPSSVHVLNAVSPAFTRAFAFFGLLVDRLDVVSKTAHVA